MGTGQQTSSDLLLQPDDVLEMRQIPADQGAMCAVLTPAIKAKFANMTAGQILEIRVDDPTAREDLASWCRLSGNELLAAREVPPGTLSAFVRKKAD